MGFSLYFVVSSIDHLVWVREQPLCWDFFVKFAVLSEDFAKEGEI